MEKPIIPQNLLNKLHEDANFQAFIQNAPNQNQPDLNSDQKSLLQDLDEQLLRLQALLKGNN